MNKDYWKRLKKLEGKNVIVLFNGMTRDSAAIKGTLDSVKDGLLQLRASDSIRFIDIESVRSILISNDFDDDDDD